MPHEDRLHLSGPLAQQFLSFKVGKDVSLTISGKLLEVGLRPEYPMGQPVPLGKKPKKEPKPKEIAHAEIQIFKVNGKSGKKVEDMDSEEMEEEITKTKGGI